MFFVSGGACGETVIVGGSGLDYPIFESVGKVRIQRFSFHLWVNSRTKLGSLTLEWQPVLEKKKLSIETSCRPGEGWAQRNYS